MLQVQAHDELVEVGSVGRPPDAIKCGRFGQCEKMGGRPLDAIWESGNERESKEARARGKNAVRSVKVW